MILHKKPIKAQAGIKSPYDYTDNFFESSNLNDDKLQPIYWMPENVGGVLGKPIQAKETVEHKWLNNWWTNQKTLEKLVSNGSYSSVDEARAGVTSGLNSVGNAGYYWTGKTDINGTRYDGKGFKGMWESGDASNITKEDRVYLNRNMYGDSDNRLITLHELMHGLTNFTNINDKFATNVLSKGNLTLKSRYGGNTKIPYRDRNIENSQFMRYYLGHSGEIYPRLMTMRSVMKLVPGQTVTPEMIKSHEYELKGAGLPEFSSAAKGQIGEEQLLKLLSDTLNSTAYNSNTRINKKGPNSLQLLKTDQQETYG